MNNVVHDIVGVGFGPGNIALAIALEEKFPTLTARFLEARPDSRWQANMMIANADIQHNPHMDLATPRNPRSRFSFNNFLHETGRFFRHYNLGLEFPLRQEYSDYVLWASQQFAHLVEYNTEAAQIRVVQSPTTASPVYEVRARDGRVFFGRTLVLGHGRPAFVPDAFKALPSEKCVHLNAYKSTIDQRANDLSRVAVIGASQSAVEILLDLTERYPEIDVVNYVRHFGYRQKDLSPQMEASIYPENVEAFYKRSWADRKKFNDDLKYQNYSSADIDVLRELNLRNYVRALGSGQQPVTIRNNSRITHVGMENSAGRVQISSEEIYTGQTSSDDVDLVILATGFRDMGPRQGQDRMPALVKPMRDAFSFDEEGVIDVTLDYRLKQLQPSLTPPIFLNGLCEGTHGVSDAGSFSLLALRTEKIAHAVVAQLASADTVNTPTGPARELAAAGAER